MCVTKSVILKLCYVALEEAIEEWNTGQRKKAKTSTTQNTKVETISGKIQSKRGKSISILILQSI